MKKNPYEVLGVSRKTTFDEIEKVYKSMTEKYNSDIYQNEEDKKTADEKMKEIKDAYGELYRLQIKVEQKVWFIIDNYDLEKDNKTLFDKAINFIDNGKFKQAFRCLKKISNYKGSHDTLMQDTIKYNYCCAMLYYRQEDLFNAYYYTKKMSDILSSLSEYKEDISNFILLKTGHDDIYLSTDVDLEQAEKLCSFVKEKVDKEKKIIDDIRIQFENGNYDECKKELKKYAEERKFYPAEYYVLWTLIYLHENNKKEALKNFSGAMKIKDYKMGPKEPELVDILSEYQQTRENKKRNINIFAKILSVVLEVLISVLAIVLTVALYPLLVIAAVIDFFKNTPDSNFFLNILYSFFAPFVMLAMVFMMRQYIEEYIIETFESKYCMDLP